jgi:hypothetical protein
MPSMKAVRANDLMMQRRRSSFIKKPQASQGSQGRTTPTSMRGVMLMAEDDLKKKPSMVAMKVAKLAREQMKAEQAQTDANGLESQVTNPTRSGVYSYLNGFNATALQLTQSLLYF